MGLSHPDFSFGVSGKVWLGIFVVIVVVAVVIVLTVEGVITMDQAYIISGVTIAIFVLALIGERSGVRQPL